MSLFQSFKSFIGFDEEQAASSFTATLKQKQVTSRPQVKEKPVLTEFPVIKNIVKNNNAHGKNMGIIITEPRSYENDSQQISAYLKDGQVVVINLKYLDAAAGKRLIDFVCGTIYAFDGYVKKLGGNIFLCTPGSVSIFDEQQDDIVFNPEEEKYMPDNQPQETLYQQVG